MSDGHGSIGHGYTPLMIRGMILHVRNMVRSRKIAWDFWGISGSTLSRLQVLVRLFKSCYRYNIYIIIIYIYTIIILPGPPSSTDKCVRRGGVVHIYIYIYPIYI